MHPHCAWEPGSWGQCGGVGVITGSGAQGAAYSNCLDDGSYTPVLETATWMKFFLGDQTLHMEDTFLPHYFLWTLSASPLSSGLASGLGSSFGTEKDRLLFIFLAIFILGHRIRLNKHHLGNLEPWNGSHNFHEGLIIMLKSKNTNSKRYMHPSVHSSIIYSC